MKERENEKGKRWGSKWTRGEEGCPGPTRGRYKAIRLGIITDIKCTKQSTYGACAACFRESHNSTMDRGTVLTRTHSALTLNVNLDSMILDAIRIAGSAQIVALIRLLDVRDCQLCIVVDDVVPANWHRAAHLGPCQWRLWAAIHQHTICKLTTWHHLHQCRTVINYISNQYSK